MKTKKMSLLTLTLVSSSLVTSVRNLTTIAETQMKMLFFVAIAAIFFFIPTALVSAELATGWPEKGGVYSWVKHAFGKKWGFFSSWLQWVYCQIGVVSTLYFFASTLAYIIDPALSTNKIFIAIVCLLAVWVFTGVNLLGQNVSSLVSSLGFTFGVLTPAVLIISLGIIYMFLGDPIQMDTSFTFDNILPDFGKVSTLVLLLGFIRAFGGIEVAACHANSVENPKRNFPISILIVVIFGICVNVFGAMAVGFAIPRDKINLMAGLIAAFHDFLEVFHIGFFTPVLGILIIFGACASIASWLMGPIKGLASTSEDGGLPPFLCKTNKHGAYSTLLIFQGCIISLISIFLLFLPNLNLAFWTSVALAMTMYTVMYALLLLAGIRLRYSQPHVERKYKIPFGNVGIWVVVVLGLITLVIAFALNFIPPAEFPINPYKYTGSLIVLALIFYAIPAFINYHRKDSWKVTKKSKD